VIDYCYAKLRELEDVREASIHLSREALRDARRAVSLAHRGELAEAEGILMAALSRRSEFLEGVGPDARSLAIATLAQSTQELVEALLLVKMLSGGELPSPEDLGVGCREYVLGLADAALELRRAALNSLSKGDSESARGLVGLMEVLLDRLSLLVFPDSLLPVRHKIDTLRALIDRTRSDILCSAGRGGSP